jgi:tRNA threonylcarbamoyl adenosine modification protein YeaZ
MKILALEFSSARRSVALVTEGQALEAVSETDARSTTAFALIGNVLKTSGLDRRDIECIAVGLGPGSYTGVRVGISIAQGWQIATGVKLLGVSSADAIAEQARRDGIRGAVTCAIDAQRQEFYTAVYELKDDERHVTQPLRIETLAQLKERAAGGEMIISPDAPPVSARKIFPTALVMATLASSRSDFVAGEKLEPIYLRETAFVKAPPPRFAAT